MLHCKWSYENIHKVHHEYKTPIGFAAPYAHWAEIWMLGIPAFLGPVLVPGHIVTYWLWFILRQLEAIETHSGYEFPWSFTKYIPFYGGPAYHDYHHFVGGTSQGNFASVFTYCDYIYGTQKVNFIFLLYFQVTVFFSKHLLTHHTYVFEGVPI